MENRYNNCRYNFQGARRLRTEALASDLLNWVVNSNLNQWHYLQDGVVLGADTRSTSGSTVADKNCEKIHYIAPNIYCCGAGTAADTENVTSMSDIVPAQAVVL